jgi:hypothetical protein
MIGTVVTAISVCTARAQDVEGATAPAAPAGPGLEQNDPANTNVTPGKTTDDQSERKPGIKAKHSPGVDDVFQMIQASVSTEVIKTYIENSPTRYSLTPGEIVALKKQGVPDELTSAMLKRGAMLAAQSARQSQAGTLVLPPPGGIRPYGGLDPESYDYFQYYYLYPRTLAAANQRFFTPYPGMQGFGAYPYGYYGPMPFNPLPPSAFRHP